MKHSRVNDAVLGHQRSVLAYLMTEPSAGDRFLHRISPALFTAPNDKVIAAIVDLHDKGEKVNLATVSDTLSKRHMLAECGGRAEITANATQTSSAQNPP